MSDIVDPIDPFERYVEILADDLSEGDEIEAHDGSHTVLAIRYRDSEPHLPVWVKMHNPGVGSYEFEIDRNDTVRVMR